MTCDTSRIGQLVFNLLGNALTYVAASEPVRLWAARDAERFELSVSNAGEPIPAHMLERLFQPFYRGIIGSSRDGLGLGLYIACEIAKAHGGRLTVTSTADETRFTLIIPAR